jgi:hypothetical protein
LHNRKNKDIVAVLVKEKEHDLFDVLCYRQKNKVYCVIFIFVAITALNQTGIDTTLITSNVTMIFGAMLLAFGISYGFASQSIMSNMLLSFYKRALFTKGLKIRVPGLEGVFKAMDSLSVTLECGDKTEYFPIKC